MPYPTLPSTSPPALSRDPDPALRLRPSVAAGTLAVAALTGLAVWALAVPVGGFDLVVAGKMNKQIAAQLGAAEKTVKVHRGRVTFKMRVRSVAELVTLATQAREATRPPL